jgi:argininosuccinate lyase
VLAANQAHVVMLARQGIITQANAQALLAAIGQVEEAGLESLAYRPGIEDLFFHVEGRLIEICGPEYGGNLQLARSRNDLGHALTRMALRPVLLDLYRRLLDLRATVLDLAGRHVHTVMPGYTHTQPAQPTTFAHYLAGVLSFLQRDTERLRRAYNTDNQSPLGAAAFTGTGFAIDRELSASLLGFAGVMVSSQDSIGASDHQTDIAAALATLAVNLSRVTHDLLFRATRESGAIRIDDSFIQISSIMPQKRNPVVLEQIEPTLFSATATADDILHLYEAVFATLQLNVDHLRAEAAAGFTTATELADTLVREASLPFRTAHEIVSGLVRKAIAADLDTADITPELLAEVSQEILGEPLDLDAELLARALDPAAFVEVRTVLGGAAASATTAVLRAQSDRLSEDQTWLNNEEGRLATASTLLQQQVDLILQ